MMNEREYYLGLVPRPKSVGWAVTDSNYNLLKLKGKELWGVRNFDEAETAEERRIKRISRRLHQRKVARIGMVKSYFDEAIRKVDPNFMVRLDNSKYHTEDKDKAVRYGYNLFNDENYTDVEYYKDYPTIYHLRQDLVHNFNPDKHDARFVFLAILNMFKHRGHFLNAGLSSDTDERNMQEIYNDFTEVVRDAMNIAFPVDINVAVIEEVLSNKKYSKTMKSEELYELFGVDKKNKEDSTKIKLAIINAICGRKINLKNIFESEMEEIEEKIEFSFRDADYEEKLERITEIVGDDNCRVIELMKEICDKGFLAGIMRGCDYLSDARVQMYNKHHEDVKILKEVFKQYLTSKDYEYMFNSTGNGSYSAYVGSYNSYKTGKHRRGVGKNGGVEELYKKIKDLFKKANVDEEDERIAYILNEIETESFLPKQATSLNAIIPNQVHLKELKKILSNAEEYHTFLKEKDDSGLSVSERIVELFKFQIPYYIGPVTERSHKNGGNGWVIRHQEGTVFPWNFSKMINEKATAEKFIEKLIKNCTYVNEEKVLPKMSLEYEAYKVLNEINNLKIDGVKISVELKQRIYNDLFKTGKKVNKSQLVDYLKREGHITLASQLTGIDININNYLSSYGKFKVILGDIIDNKDVTHMVEDIIKWSTIYGNSKNLLKAKIEELYKDKFTPEQIKKILGYKFKDWGSLSKEFLELKGYDKVDKVKKPLINALWDNNINMIELINSELFTYKEALLEKQTTMLKTLSEFEEEDLNDYYFSAPVKRMIWQTILIVRELTDLLGATPKKIFIQTLRREDNVKQRTFSRKQKLLKLYESVDNKDQNWAELIEEADSKGLLNIKKVYLFFLQQGRCMYTGNKIDFDELLKDDTYNIDHIYPRHFVKDDNLENNLVLVDKEVNKGKEDFYPIQDSIYLSQKNRWRYLYEKGFITEEKLNRLLGRDPLTDEQKAGFIARQLVEINQGSKGVIEIIKGLIPSSTVVCTKAANIADFRQEFDIPKCTIVNEFYHANEAYLSIVVGNIYHTKFTSNPYNFIKNEYSKNTKKYNYNLSKMYKWNVERNGVKAWVAGDDGTITTVKKTVKKNTPLMTRTNFVGHGKIANDTIYDGQKASTGEGYIPLKTSDEKMADLSKYGGVTSVSTAYFFIVKHKVKGKYIRTIETVPVYMKDAIEADPNKLEEYCEKQLGLVDFSIRVRKIKIQSLIKVNGYIAYITGRSSSAISITNAINLCLAPEWMAYIKKLEKYKDFKKVDKEISIKKNMELFTILKDKFIKSIYNKRPNSIAEKLADKDDVFEALSAENQCELLCNILQCSAIGGNLANLELLGEPKGSGSMKFNKNISLLNSLYLVNQSVTGVYENTVDLLNC